MLMIYAVVTYSCFIVSLASFGAFFPVLLRSWLLQMSFVGFRRHGSYVLQSHELCKCSQSFIFCY